MGESRPTVIAHISDMHCGSPYYLSDLAARVVQELNELAPDVVVVTGDLTDMGFRSQFEDARDVLSGLECPSVLVLMGNHDARNVGDEHFDEIFGREGRQLAVKDVRILGLDSSQPDVDHGRVGRERHRWIQENFSGGEVFRVVAMHHHLVPVPHTGRERNIVEDAGDMLQALAISGTDLVLCGHKHVPNVWRLEDMLIVNAGTCCSGRLRGKVSHSYNIIEVHDCTFVRVLLKQPYEEAQVVGEYRGINADVCSWRSTLDENGSGFAGSAWEMGEDY